MPTTVIITNDFPPRVGGIESFIADIVELLDRDVVVYTSASPGSAAVDRRVGVEVVRAGRVLWPSPDSTRDAVALLQRSGASRVLFGAAAPLGLMAGPLRRAGAERIVALSHGHETWWATLPGSRSLLRRIGDEVDHLTTISDYTASRIAPALSASARSRMRRLAPPVDTEVFRPAPQTGAHERPPRLVAVGRLVRQKGFETLLPAWRLVLDAWPSELPQPELVLVGDGPRRRQLEALTAGLQLRSTVRFLGSMPRTEVIGQLQHSDAFALPVRTRFGGLNPEGLGLAALEAAACGLPVVVGHSGGAPETLLDGRTGYVVDPHDPHQLADRITALLRDTTLARAMGAEGRRFVTEAYGAGRVRDTLREALGLT